MSQNSATPANARQVGGDHYKHEGGEEHWDRVARLNLDYFQGQTTKYVERWKLKNGIQDLEKARHFLDKYIELAKAGALHDWKPDSVEGAVMGEQSRARHGESWQSFDCVRYWDHRKAEWSTYAPTPLRDDER